MTRVGDLASEISDRLQREHMAAVEAGGEQFIDEAAPMIRDTKKGLSSKIQFVWRPDDRKIVEQIRVGVDGLFSEMFDEMINIMDEFYGQMRVPALLDGIVQTDGSGRIVWQKDSNGKDIEDWSQLTGQDIEKTILDITRLKLILAPLVNDLMLEAVFAKHIFDDKTHEAYAAVMDGTVKDREAYASREARVDKYHAYFRFYLYSHAETFMREVNNFSRILERIRFWRIDDSGAKSPGL